ncbi:TlpA family protein disulfide reductase [Paraglaciecola aquimarina]|uniref:TlpA family protein disulfide reductase n=1 Tax=Paraglaciecola algarum TaxID=3050085 RepID=A0ABS9D6D9_9ALTE|nr:TlpA disulfide reductase family protein [Paraglaciecola sp. G1-23]MCF2948455.1 TlpA family protein disulfide reductase [Paraglaciecola sp. G1-23]
MKNIRLLMAVLFCLTTQQVNALDNGEIVPNLTLLDWNNTPVAIADYKGKVLYIDFWASWCIPCKKSFPFMNDLQAKYGKQGFQVLAINMDEEKQDAEKFLKKYPADFTILQGNSDLAKAFKLTGLPMAFIVNQNGKLMAKHSGFNQNNKKKVILQIEHLLVGNR